MWNDLNISEMKTIRSLLVSLKKQFSVSYDMGYKRFAKIDSTDIFDVSNITKKFVSVLIIAKYPISSYNKIP